MGERSPISAWTGIPSKKDQTGSKENRNNSRVKRAGVEAGSKLSSNRAPFVHERKARKPRLRQANCECVFRAIAQTREVRKQEIHEAKQDKRPRQALRP